MISGTMCGAGKLSLDRSVRLGSPAGNGIRPKRRGEKLQLKTYIFFFFLTDSEILLTIYSYFILLYILIIIFTYKNANSPEFQLLSCTVKTDTYSRKSGLANT